MIFQKHKLNFWHKGSTENSLFQEGSQLKEKPVLFFVEIMSTLFNLFNES